MDYYVWGVVERDSSCLSHKTVAALRDAIVDAMAKIPKTHLITVCIQFWQHTEAVIVADSGFIECVFPLYLIIFAKF